MQFLRRNSNGNNTKPISKEFKDVLEKLLVKDPAKRISMFDLQNHPWMDMFDEDLEKSIEDSKLEEEEEKKAGEEEDDTEYINMLKKSKDPDVKPSIIGHNKIENRLGDLSLGKKSPKGRSSPRHARLSPRNNGSGVPKAKKSKSGKPKKKSFKGKPSKN